MSIWSRIERRITDIAGDLLPDEVREQIGTARDRLNEGEAAQAVEILTDVLATRPEHTGALSLLGIAELDRENPSAALEAFDRALAVRSDLPDVCIGRGQALMSLGDHQRAAQSYRRAIESADGDRELLAVAYRGLGLVHHESGELDKAVRELRKAVAEAPRDPLALTALAEALHEHTDVGGEEAKKYLGWARESTAPARAYWLSGVIALADGQLDAADEFFREGHDLAEVDGHDRDRAGALVGRGDVALANGELIEAQQFLLRALEVANDRVDVHERLATLHRRSGNPEAALTSADRALELGGSGSFVRAALTWALDESDLERTRRYAEMLAAESPDDPLASIAVARVLTADGDPGQAISTLEKVLTGADVARAHLELGRLRLEAGAFAEAANSALAAMRESDLHSESRALLAQARRRELGDMPTESGATLDLLAGFALLERLCRTRPELTPFAAAVSEAAFDFDRPLLVTVMGEFSSGKSTFVNAFIGAEVAPTGITPTTATINIARHGRERGGRLIYRDDRSEDIGWEPLFARLRSLSATEAAEISRVEIMLPLDILERVNLVDTPGLNSILPEHEQVARDFIARADAVVWVFSAGQAGKKSEREALDAIADQGVRVLGALNKIDQLSEGDAEKVLEMVTAELGERLEAIVPVSARKAVEGAAGSNWPALESSLETHFFARAKKLKAHAAQRKVRVVLEAVESGCNARLATLDEAADRVDQAAAELRERLAKFADEVVLAERKAIATDLGTLYRDAAREVLELVLPRSLPFGSNKATPADRDYLISLLETRLESALARSRRRVDHRFHQACAAGLRAELDAAPLLGAQRAGLARAIDDATRLLDAQVYTSALSYLRGYLRGGYVDHFFRSDLPKIDLAEDAIYHALYRDSANVDQLVGKPLLTAGMEALGSIADRLDGVAGSLRALAADVTESCVAPLETVRQRFELS